MLSAARVARAVLSVAAIIAIVPVHGYSLPGAQQPLPDGYEPVAPGQAPQDTPAVARARAEHLAAVQRAVSRTRAAVGAASVVPLTLSAPAPTWSSGYSSTAAPWAAVQQVPVNPTFQDNGPADTFDVAAEKAKHFAAVEAAKRRLSSDVPTPVEYTPEVAAARADHLAAVAAAEARDAAEANGVASTVATPTDYAAPQVLTKVHASHFAHAGFLRPRTQDERHYQYYSQPAPVAAPTPVPVYQPVPQQYLAPVPAPVPVASGGYSNNLGEDDGQYHGNEEPSSGEYSYSYNDGLSSKTESRTADGITRGSYSYYDASGVLQTLSYEADDVNGFRVYGSNLPQVSPAVAVALGNPNDAAAAVAAASAGSIPDTPEVAAAKQAHFAAYREALQRLQAENH